MVFWTHTKLVTDKRKLHVLGQQEVHFSCSLNMQGRITLTPYHLSQKQKEGDTADTVDVDFETALLELSRSWLVHVRSSRVKRKGQEIVSTKSPYLLNERRDFTAKLKTCLIMEGKKTPTKPYPSFPTSSCLLHAEHRLKMSGNPPFKALFKPISVSDYWQVSQRKHVPYQRSVTEVTRRCNYYDWIW